MLCIKKISPQKQNETKRNTKHSVIQILLFLIPNVIQIIKTDIITFTNKLTINSSVSKNIINEDIPPKIEAKTILNVL